MSDDDPYDENGDIDTEGGIVLPHKNAKGTDFDHGGAPARRPCGSCPYRKDVPPGVWARSEYEKLPGFDLETADQPIAVFFCHQQDGRLCAGYVGCHDMTQSLGMRLAVPLGSITMDAFDAALDYECPVPLHESGQAAHDHGVSGIEAPPERATRIIDRLVRKHLPG